MPENSKRACKHLFKPATKLDVLQVGEIALMPGQQSDHLQTIPIKNASQTKLFL